MAIVFSLDICSCNIFPRGAIAILTCSLKCPAGLRFRGVCSPHRVRLKIIL
jgi:hypothetical protein